MKLDAVGVTSSDIRKSVEFYKILGFEFDEFDDGEQHVESVVKEGSIRLMIDHKELMESLLGEEPKPGNHASFAIAYESANEVNEIVRNLIDSGFKVKKEPFDAFWGQRYAMVVDPEGYTVDLYAKL